MSKRQPAHTAPSSPARRRWLGAAALTVVVPWALPGCSSLPVIPARPSPDADAALGWIRFAEGRYQLWLPRAEMGQQVDAALRQIAAEELGVPPEAIHVARPSTADIAPVRATVGSESIALFALPLAQACATLREARAAGRTGTLQAEALPPERLRSFGPGTRWVGQGLADPALPALLRGEARYAADVRLPGMLYGRVLRAATSPDLPARLAQANEAAARAVPGFVALVRDEALTHGRSEGLGIVARTPGALDRIEAALAARWQTSGSFQPADLARAIDVDARLARGALPHTVADEQPAGAPAAAPASPPPPAPDWQPGDWPVDLRIVIDAAPHAGIEPRCAVASFGPDGRLQLWCGSQDTFFVRAVLARRLGLDAERVLVHGQRIGGAFGGRTICTVELEAAVLARAVRAPIKLQWTRAQEWQQGFHRPPSSHRIRARVADGRLQAWWHAFVSTPILLTNAALPEWLNPVTRVIGDQGAARGAALPYRAAHRRTEYALQRLPLYCGPWRGLGAGPNALAIESAIDACARAAGADPLAFRLAQVASPRLAAVLRQAAAAAGWGTPGRHLGLACGIYKGNGFAAVVAEVAARGGRWVVVKLTCALDCGRIVNPDAVRAQTEGNLVWGLGMVFGAALPVADGAVAAQGLAEAGLPRLSDVPPLQIDLLPSTQPPGAAGETAIVAAAGAIANALTAASAHRPLRFPLPADAPARHDGASAAAAGAPASAAVSAAPASATR